MTHVRAISMVAAVLLLLAAATILARPAQPHPGIVSEQPAGDWVTSTWPTTYYYTTRAQVGVWGQWAAKNRVWFDAEAALLAAYPSRVRK